MDQDIPFHFLRPEIVLLALSDHPTQGLWLRRNLGHRNRADIKGAHRPISQILAMATLCENLMTIPNRSGRPEPYLDFGFGFNRSFLGYGEYDGDKPGTAEAIIGHLYAHDPAARNLSERYRHGDADAVAALATFHKNWYEEASRCTDIARHIQARRFREWAAAHSRKPSISA